jgi:hypothetical protein
MTLEFLKSMLSEAYSQIEQIFEQETIQLSNLSNQSLQDLILPDFSQAYRDIGPSLLHPACSYAAVKGYLSTRAQTSSVEVLAGLLVYVTPQVIESFHNLSTRAELLQDNSTRLNYQGRVLLVTREISAEKADRLMAQAEALLVFSSSTQLLDHANAASVHPIKPSALKVKGQSAAQQSLRPGDL